MKTENGYATLLTCILIPVVFLTLGLIAFSMLKSQHRSAVQSTCHVQYHDYFSNLRAQIYSIENLNPMATLLYQTQLALTPYILVPSVLKVYQAILKLRQRMEKLQNSMIAIFNFSNRLKSVTVFSNIQKKLQWQNKLTEKTLRHESQLTFSANPKLQIKKRVNIVFPPYDRHPQLSERQKFSIFLKNKIVPQSWMTFFSIESFTETYVCQASLQSDSNNELLIKYKI